MKVERMFPGVLCLYYHFNAPFTQTGKALPHRTEREHVFIHSYWLTASEKKQNSVQY